MICFGLIQTIEMVGVFQDDMVVENLLLVKISQKYLTEQMV